MRFNRKTSCMVQIMKDKKPKLIKLIKFKYQMEKITLMASTEILKAVLIKEGHIAKKPWLQKINFTLAIVSIIYLSITNSIVNATNIIFAFIMDADTLLHHVQRSVAIFTWQLFACCLNIVLPAAILIFLRYKNEGIEASSIIQSCLRNYLAFSLMLYEILIVPFYILLFSYIQDSLWIVAIFITLMVATINFIFKVKHLYKEYFMVIILIAWAATPDFFPICMILLNLILIVKGVNVETNCSFIQILVINAIMFVNANFTADITVTQLAIIALSIPAIFTFMPRLFDYQSILANQIILAALQKLENGEILTRNKEHEIYSIFQTYLIEAEKQNVVLDQEQKIELENLYKKVNKKSLAFLLRCKINFQKLYKPLDLILDIQYAQEELYRNSFNIETLIKIEKINRSVFERGVFTEKLRMMKLTHKLESEYNHMDDKSNCTAIIHVEKSIERFNHKLDDILSHYCSIWKDHAKNNHEKEYMDKVSKLCDAEEECINLLKSIRKFKDTHIEQLIFDYIQKQFNLSEANIFPAPQKYSATDKGFKSTRYILISDNKILDISQQLADQLGTRQPILIGSSIFSIIPRQFQQFYINNINKWLNTHEDNIEVILPLNSMQNPNFFFPFKCYFKILPDIEGGVKYLIHILNNFERSNECYLLYSFLEDRILMFSKIFYEEYTSFGQQKECIKSDFTAQQLLGLDLTFLGTYKMEENNQELICEINLNTFEKKTTAKKVCKPRLFSLKLSSIYEIENDRLFLLTITPIKESRRTRTLHELIISQNIRFTREEYKSGKSVNQSKNFCLIKNPYEEIIQQRLNKKKPYLGQSYVKFTFLTFVVIFLVIVSSFIYFKVIVNQSVNGLSSNINTFVNELSNYEGIYRLFYQYYIYIHAFKYPQHFILPGSQLNPADYVAQSSKKVTKALDTLIAMSIDKNMVLTQNHFGLNYPGYALNGLTNSLTLIPLLENIKASLITHQFDFVIQNSKIVDLYINSLVPINTDIIHSILNQQFYYLVSAFILIVTAALIIKFQYLKVRMVLWTILDYYDQLQQEHISEQQNKLKKFKILLHNGSFKGNSKLSAETQKQIKELDPLKCAKSSNQAIVKQSLFKAFLSNNSQLVCIIIIVGIFYLWCYFSLDSYRKDIEQVINYTSIIQYVSKINTATAQKFYQTAVQQILPASKRTYFQVPIILNLPDIAAFNLPLFFEGFTQLQVNILKTSMCDSPEFIAKVNKDLLLATMNCSKVMHGVLTNGFNEGYPYTLASIQSFTGTNLSDLKNIFDSDSVYPYFADVIYSRRILDAVIENLNAAFTNSINAFLLTTNDQFNSIIAFGVLLFFGVCGLIIVYLWKIATICKLGRKCFNLLPKNFIFKIKNSKNLLNQGLLDQIQLLQP